MSLPPPPLRFQVFDNEAVSPEPLSFVTVRAHRHLRRRRPFRLLRRRCSAAQHYFLSARERGLRCGPTRGDLSIGPSVRLATLTLVVNEGY